MDFKTIDNILAGSADLPPSHPHFARQQKARGKSLNSGKKETHAVKTASSVQIERKEKRKMVTGNVVTKTMDERLSILEKKYGIEQVHTVAGKLTSEQKAELMAETQEDDLVYDMAAMVDPMIEKKVIPPTDPEEIAEDKLVDSMLAMTDPSFKREKVTKSVNSDEDQLVDEMLEMAKR